VKQGAGGGGQGGAIGDAFITTLPYRRCFTLSYIILYDDDGDDDGDDGDIYVYAIYL